MKAVANPAPQSLLPDGPQSETEGEGHTRFKSEEEKEQEVLKQRELEQELENERPCVFKSISPVSTFAIDQIPQLNTDLGRHGVMPI